MVSRRWIDPETAADIGRLDPDAIDKVRQEAWPEMGTVDECHDALMQLYCLDEVEVERAGIHYQTQQLIRDRRAMWLEPQNGARRILVALERLAYWNRVAGQLYVFEPDRLAQSETFWHGEREQALTEIVRGRLECSGPVTVAQFAGLLQLPEQDIGLAMLALEGEGFAMRGSFSNSSSEEWCERRLLARINRYTLNRLRAEIEPLSGQDFMRYLFEWQHLTPSSQMEGPEAVAEIITQLEGMHLPAIAWEADVLPGRIRGYQPGWLDMQCQSGRIAWGRFSPMNKGKARSQAIRNTPITLVYREQLAAWQGARKGVLDDELSADAQKLLKILQQRGASFFSELISRSGLLRTQVENALSELVAHGRISADSFSGLRALLTPASRRPSIRSGRRRRKAANPIELAGRWGLLDSVSTVDDQAADDDATEAIAWSLLRRYGVITRRLLERESLAPPWRELLRIYRRLEARGEIRGGRFVARFTGEQYALPEAVTMMRKVRKQPHDGAEIRISASDPLNLTGIISSGERVSSSHTRQILYQDGEMVRVVH